MLGAYETQERGGYREAGSGSQRDVGRLSPAGDDLVNGSTCCGLRIGPTWGDLVDAVTDAGLRLNAGTATASDREMVEAYALGAIVGSAAGRRFSGSDNLGTADREAVVGLAFRLLDDSVWSAQEWLDSLLSETREFVKTHREEIEFSPRPCFSERR